jgi:molybdopterin converting factor small subunit
MWGRWSSRLIKEQRLLLELNKESSGLQVSVRLFGAARVIIGQSSVDVSFTSSMITLREVLEQLIAAYPRVRPYVLDEAGQLPPSIRVLINHVRPNHDATLATVLHDRDHVTLLVAVAGG